MGRVEREFQQMARRAHLKRCPRCTAPMERCGWDDSVTCHCGHRFSWRSAPTVVPCGRVHLREKGFPFWCRTCPDCKPIAKVKLAAVRTGVVVGTPIAGVAAIGVAGTVAATVATAAVVTTAVPAVVCAPLALAYEPVRRVRRRSRNPFLRGMGAGA